MEDEKLDDELNEYDDKSIEDLFQQFIEAVKDLPTEDNDEIINDLNTKEKNKNV